MRSQTCWYWHTSSLLVISFELMQILCLALLYLYSIILCKCRIVTYSWRWLHLRHFVLWWILPPIAIHILKYLTYTDHFPGQAFTLLVYCVTFYYCCLSFLAMFRLLLIIWLHFWLPNRNFSRFLNVYFGKVK